ncbi:MAG: deoxyribodipyrimidine photolyase [Candidatus Eisenbacteria bacterium]|uniref:Deoxyribodipyrimidine photo-lyase n=1 Tax=Eiseniibacteriota bacterium TaxID=2212470 RepID=A0A7Y2E9Q0_UNCEI|nr:deoxyribodipyrimidine photolyase [Candidatus Eisenbacteria bacterium]
MIKPTFSELRINQANQQPLQDKGKYVLYWMIANRRLQSNFSLDRAVAWCHELKLPLLIFEPLRIGYDWASDRHHQFVVDGMVEKQQELEGSEVAYFPYLEQNPGEGKGLLEHLAKQAAIVITDEYPCFFLPRMVSAAAKALTVRLETVDSNGMFPLRSMDRVFLTAYALRRWQQQNFRDFYELPKVNPLRKLPAAPKSLVSSLVKKNAAWKPLNQKNRTVSNLDIDHSVPVSADLPGGSGEGTRRLKEFAKKKLDDYAEKGNRPMDAATSGLSPYLHFGHVGSHSVFRAIAAAEDWSPDKLGTETKGKRSGWWGTSESAEGFFNQLITWRELGFNQTFHRSDYDQFDSLPGWAIETLSQHKEDPRTHLYELKDFEEANTHDELWNAAQNQLRLDGIIHNYLRMLWGKKILEWTPSPEAALEIMLELNNKYALDGRDPNSYSGIFWVLGRYDRPWGPERPVYGKIRYMSSDNTARKLPVKEYVAKYNTPRLF